MQAWGFVAAIFGGGAAGAAIIKLMETIIVHKLDRAAKKEDKQAAEAAADDEQMAKDIDDLKWRTGRDYDRLNRHDKLLESISESIQALLKAVNAVLLHNMTGNATGKMAEAQKELMDHIIEKGETK